MRYFIFTTMMVVGMVTSADPAVDVTQWVKRLGDMPSGPAGDSVRRGKSYVEETHLRLPQHVGARMNCTSCHLNGGTTPDAGPWVGIVGRFPQYRDRSAKMDTLPDRINDCFERSMNGKRLPEASQEMTDILSYMAWLSQGVQVGQKIKGMGMAQLDLKRKPNLAHGEKVYQAKCLSCHQEAGNGMYLASDRKVVFPPLWGEHSFNIGAGMARQRTAAGFVKHNMPLGQGGTLSDDEAWDVAAYFIQKARPDFKNKHKDWKSGGKPKDARY